MFMCVTNRIYDFNNFLKYLIVTIFIINLLFTVYITIVRAINIKKLIKEGDFDVRNSPLDRMSTIIARMLACTKGICETGGTVAGAVAGLYTIDNIMKDLGFEPIFLPFVKRAITTSSDAFVDNAVETDKNNQILTKNLRQVQSRQLNAKEEEGVFQMFYDSGFISKDEWMELQREFKTRYTIIEGEKESLLTKIKENLEKGYGAFEGSTDHGLTENYPTSSKVIEALKDNGHLMEDLFPKPPLDTPNSSKIIEALRDSGQPIEDTFSTNTADKSNKDSIIKGLIDKSNSSLDDFSKNKDSIGEIKSLTGSERDNFSQSNKE